MQQYLICQGAEGTAGCERAEAADASAPLFKTCLVASRRRSGTFICHNHQQGCTLVTLLRCNNRVPNYFGKYAVTDVFLPLSLRDIISALHVDI